MTILVIGSPFRFTPIGGPEPPIANDDTVIVAEEATEILDIVGNDQYVGDKSALTAEIWNGSAWTTSRAMALGTATVRGDNDIDFAAAAVAASGSSFFDYRITDAIGISNTGRVSFTVVNVAGSAPVAAGNSFSVDEQMTTVLDVVANDTFVGDKADLTVQIWNGTAWTDTRAMAQGTATVRSDNDINFTAATVASDTAAAFDYRIIDANGISNTGTVNLTVLNVPQVPVAAANTFGVNEGVTTVLDVVANDQFTGAKSSLTVEIWNGSIWTTTRAMAAGTVTVRGDKNLDFAAAAVGADTEASFDYRITDAEGTSAGATVTVTVLNEVQPPTATGDTFSVNESATTVLDVVANDQFTGLKSALTVQVWDGSSWTTSRAMAAGTVTVRSDLNLDFAANAVSSDTPVSFDYRITDSEGISAAATVNLTVRNSVPTLPVAVGNTFAVNESTTAVLNVVANDTFTGLKSALTVEVWNGSIWTNTRVMAAGTVTVRSDKDLDFAAAAVSADTVASFDYRITDSEGTSSGATVNVTVVNAATGGGVGPIEPVNGSLLQVAISVGTSARQSWWGYGFGTNSTVGGASSPAALSLSAGTTHVQKLCEDLNATVVRMLTPENHANFTTALLGWWNLVKDHGVDTIFSSSFIYRAEPDVTPTAMANGINQCILNGFNPATWACSMQNEPEGHPDNTPPGTSGRYGAIVRTHQNELRNRLNVLGRQSVITLGLEWRHPTDSNTGPAEFDDFNAHGEVPSVLQAGCIHIYNKGPTLALYDQRYLAKGRGLWSTETGDMGSPRAQAIFVAGVNHGVVVEIAHIGISSSASPSDPRQFLVLGNGALNAWYPAIKAISRALTRGTRLRLCASSDRPEGLNTSNADQMIWTQQLRNPRQFVIAGKRSDGRWVLCAVSYAYGADSPQQQFAGGHYPAINQQLTVTIPELAGVARTWTAQRATMTGSTSSASYNMDDTGRIRFSLPAGDTVALVTTNAA